ncbi:MAG: hypothetical protein DMF59_03525 [Acidobacteria bacterium]|nr:MAG: hypothetical protein DMF59_03525 [Acidobacteriota bacterium]
MIFEVKAMQDQLKQILYGCVEHVQATRAALYLSASGDLNEKRYELVTSYAFNDAGRKVLNATDDLVDRLAVKRNAFFVNGLGSDTRLSEMLFRQGTDRLLAAPLFARGRLLGFIDMRDKAGKKPFGNPDLDAARMIADQVLSLLTSRKLFGLAPTAISVSDDTTSKALQSAIMDQRYDLSAPAVKAIEAARESMAKRQLAPTATAKKVLTESDLEIVRLLLPAALAIPGAVLACFSAIGQLETPQSIVAIAEVTEDAIESLEKHLQAWFRGVAHKDFDLSTSQPQLIYPFGEQIVPVSAAGISTILSAPVNAQSFEGLVLTVAFERIPAGQAQRALTMFLHQIENSVESAIIAGGGRSDRQLVAERLLEPDFQRYPELVDHCRQVSIMSARLATLVGLSPQQVETVRLAGLVHDVGLRLLDYERLYRRQGLTAEEMRGLAEHALVGAAIVEPLLGPEVAHAVLRHHERVDGKGYPSHMAGQTIPLASRIIQVCDAWVAMTSAASYQTALTRGDAARRLKASAGTQFDEAVVARFLKSLNEIID